MQKRKSFIDQKELLFQIVLIVVVMLFFASHREKGQITFNLSLPETISYLNLVLAALSVNYWLLPSFLYEKKYIRFSIGLMLVIALAIVIEEAVIEQIFYPDTRGKRFLGIIFNLIDILPTITVFAGFKFGWDALNKQKEIDALNKAISESELQFLKSQINPHFLFNNLNNLYSYALEQSPKTPEIILQLSAVMRYMLYECKEPFVPLNKELEQLENFIELGKLQFENRGSINLNISSDQEHYMIAPLILSVFVENAFKHSLSSQTEEIEIDIDIHINKSGLLSFKCQNKYTQDSNTDELSKGIGLENVRKRLSILYDQKHRLLIEPDQNMFSVTLELNLTKQPL